MIDHVMFGPSVSLHSFYFADIRPIRKSALVFFLLSLFDCFLQPTFTNRSIISLYLLES